MLRPEVVPDQRFLAAMGPSSASREEASTPLLSEAQPEMDVTPPLSRRFVRLGALGAVPVLVLCVCLALSPRADPSESPSLSSRWAPHANTTRLRLCRR